MPRIVDKKEKREKILEAAIFVFAKKGTAKTKTADIAEAAQIGKGTIYEYFKSKDEIMMAAFLYVIKKAEDVVAFRLSKITDPWEKFVTYLSVWKEILQSEFKDYMEIMLDFWAEGIRRKEKAATFSLKKIYDENRDWLKSILDECVSQDKIYPVNTHVVSSLILGALDGLMLQWIIDPGILDIEESLTEMEILILRGLKKEG
ncbi:MAG: TetR/AcrR family transcriptional regulator [Candidatus Aminicenantes bacterium]|nr:TetR/AcrR family transcriptional regulator [Candidatus Aminicenantes bacterium]MDH5384974.1 TetR/AcrR family transcriptional regulator [Candidatus Aminicenantes bacterium]